MKKLMALSLCAAFAISVVGCGGTSAPPTAEEKKANEEAMSADMEQMMGNITEKPGEGKTPAK